MSKPILLAFCSPADRDLVIEASFGFGGFYFDDDHIDISSEWVVLLAIGPEGGALLATWIERHGLDSVTGIGLVGVTTPWAERGACYGDWIGGSGGHKRWKRCYEPGDYVSSFDADDADPEPLCQKHFDALNPSVRDMWQPARVLLGPLEPLRAVAERARRGVECPNCDGVEGWACGHCSAGRRFPLHLVIACAPDDGVCAACSGGIGDLPHFSGEQCKACDGEGKALSSADVARELVGGVWPLDEPRCSADSPMVATSGGLSVVRYSTRERLVHEGLRAVVERLTR